MRLFSRPMFAAIVLIAGLCLQGAEKPDQAANRRLAGELLADAIVVAETITDGEEKASALQTIALAQADGGEFDAAAATAAKITLPVARRFVDRGIAVARARRGDVAAAAAAADATKDQFDRGILYIAVVESLAGRGDLAGARAAASKVTDRFSAPRCAIAIARAQAAAGDVAGARAAVEAIGGFDREEHAVEGYCAIADALLARKDAPGAKEMVALAAALVQRVPDHVRPLSVAKLARAQVKVGATPDAVAHLRGAAEDHTKTLYLATIAEAQAEAGDAVGARATAKSMPDADARAEVELAIAAAQIKSGDLAAARTSIAAARKLLADIIDPDRQAAIVAYVLETETKLGEAPVAVAAARAQKDPIARVHALCAVAGVLLER